MNGYFLILYKMLEKHLWNSFLPYLVVEILQLVHPLKICWNFEAVIQSNFADIHLESQQNLMEVHWNTGGILSPILSNFTACFSELFRLNTTHFLAKGTWILVEFLWYFDGVFMVFYRFGALYWWNFSGILMEFVRYFLQLFQSKK